MKTFIFGEAMLEYHSRGGQGLRYGGDTLNTAIHMARHGCDVAYVTALGIDPISDSLVAAWQAEGIDTSHVLRHPARSPGIYAIHLDDGGERSFLYWRDRSAAREMFALPRMSKSLEQARECALVYFSLITLAVIGESGRRSLLDVARARKAADRLVAYDSNYRSALWDSPSMARKVSRAAIETATIGLPTNTDESELAGEWLSVKAIAARWHTAGCPEVAVKAGAEGCYYSGPGQSRTLSAPIVAAIDTSGAGDAFNAGYLCAIVSGVDTSTAIEMAQALACETVQHLGALRISPPTA